MKEIKIKSLTLNNDTSKICIPILSKTFSEIEKEIDYAIKSDADLIEWRYDFFEDTLNYDLLLKVLNIKRKIPMIFTFRSFKEGGFKEHSDDVRIDIIKKVIKSKKVEFIDIEINNEKDFLKKTINCSKENDVKVILSNHNFKKTPSKESIMEILNNMKSENGDILKIAYNPVKNIDVINLISAINLFNIKKDNLIIGISMGEMGVITRVFPNICGSCITFASGVLSSAPGQLSIENLKSIEKIIYN